MDAILVESQVISDVEQMTRTEEMWGISDTFTDIGLSLAQIYQLQMETCDQFGVRLTELEMEQLDTPRKLIDYVKNRV